MATDKIIMCSCPNFIFKNTDVEYNEFEGWTIERMKRDFDLIFEWGSLLVLLSINFLL